MLEKQRQLNAQTDELPEKELVEDNKKLLRVIQKSKQQHKKMFRLVQRLKQKLAHMAALEEELEELENVLDELSLALGFCALCFGQDPSCQECHGKGKPGSMPADPGAFQKWVAPALPNSPTS